MASTSSSSTSMILILGVIALFILGGSSGYSMFIKPKQSFHQTTALSKEQLSTTLATTQTGTVMIQGANGVGLNQGNQMILAGTSDLTFNAGATPGQTRMLIKSSTGFVGIGTTNPTKTLHVSPGSILLDGTTPSILFTDQAKGIVNASASQVFGTATFLQDALVVYGAKDGALATNDPSKGGRKSILSWNSAGSVCINNNVNTAAGIPLSVYGYAGVSNGNSYITTSTTADFTSFNTSIYSEYGVVSASYGFLVLSDQRIKKNIQPVVGVLDKIEKVEIVEHEHIDKKKEEKVEYGVIAQQIQPLVPHAVHQTKEFIPNIYESAISHIVKDGLVTLQLSSVQGEIKVGQLVRLFVSDGQKEKRLDTLVKEVYTTLIAVENWAEYSESDKVFVYGTQVEDFLMVDKPQLGLMALAGVKELYQREKQLEEKVEELSRQVASLTIALKQLIKE
jgi:Chaperone of endosialidase